MAQLIPSKTDRTRIRFSQEKFTRPSTAPRIAPSLRAKAMTVRAHKVALVQFREEGLQRRIAKTADLLALQGRVPVIIIKHGRVVERDLEVAVLTGLTIQLALDEAIPPWLNVDRGEACTAEAVLLGFIKVGGLGGLTEATGFHLWSTPEYFAKNVSSFSIPIP